jgi:2-hydroxychromene-2-carboxylate isomerase
MRMEEPRFFLGAMSPYSWFAAERIERVLPDARWRGVFAGALFKANDRVSWGITDRRAEGIADCNRRAAEHGLGPIQWPELWPTNDLLVARGMIYAERDGLLKQFALTAMRLCFLEGADLGEQQVVLEAGERVGLSRAELERALKDSSVKQGLRDANEEALAAGVFGVPTVVVGGQLYWGDDRLLEAAEAYGSPTTP